MEFLAEKYGATASGTTWSGSPAAWFSRSAAAATSRRSSAKPLEELWEEYRRPRSSCRQDPAPEPLTKNGFLKQYPCPLGEDRLVYYRRDYRSRGEVVVLDLKTGQDKPLFKMDAVNGLSVAEDGKKILLSAVDHFHAFSEFSDLYEYDLEKGKLKRLSRGQRLSQPVAKIDPHVRSMKDVQALKDTLDKNGMLLPLWDLKRSIASSAATGTIIFPSSTRTGRLWIVPPLCRHGAARGQSRRAT